MINPDIVIPQLVEMTDDQLGHLRAKWEDCSDMTYLIDMVLTERLPRLEQVVAALKGKRFELHNEKALQAQVEQALKATCWPHQREVRLSPADIIDFMVLDVGIEIKIKGTPKAIYQQCERYCAHEAVTSLLLLTNKQSLLPPTINGKPTHVLNLGLAWL